MNSKEYIKNKLQNLVKLYPQLTFFYQFDEIESLHMVQVEPQDEFESNIAYQEDEADLTFDFDNSFFPESIVFISNDSLIRVNAPEFILKNYTPFKFEDILLNYSYESIKDKEYLCGENNYALAA